VKKPVNIIQNQRPSTGRSKRKQKRRYVQDNARDKLGKSKREVRQGRRRKTKYKMRRGKGQDKTRRKTHTHKTRREGRRGDGQGRRQKRAEDKRKKARQSALQDQLEQGRKENRPAETQAGIQTNKCITMLHLLSPSFCSFFNEKKVPRARRHPLPFPAFVSFLSGTAATLTSWQCGTIKKRTQKFIMTSIIHHWMTRSRWCGAQLLLHLYSFLTRQDKTRQQPHNTRTKVRARQDKITHNTPQYNTIQRNARQHSTLHITHHCFFIHSLHGSLSAFFVCSLFFCFHPSTHPSTNLPAHLVFQYKEIDFSGPKPKTDILLSLKIFTFIITFPPGSERISNGLCWEPFVFHD
jgi:hypothetical protein